MKFPRLNNKGFSLTEVMIGMMILTVAIVTATNLLVGLSNSNRDNLTTLQAYYYAVEGIEAVRNIRDTNWMHHRDWLGANSADLWGMAFVPGDEYGVNLMGSSFLQVPDSSSVENLQVLRGSAPWSVSGDGELVQSVDDEIGVTDFTRTIRITSYGEQQAGQVPTAVAVEVTVTWNLGAKERSFVLSEVLTNWKDGA